MWLKLFFLLLYFLVLFVLARFFEAIVWYETGIFATQLVDPVALSFKKLKTILECRGLGYSGLPEKKDVRELVEKSGDLMEGELYSALKEEEASESVSSTNFSGEMHFYELVEDTKDGIWLVQASIVNGAVRHNFSVTFKICTDHHCLACVPSGQWLTSVKWLAWVGRTVSCRTTEKIEIETSVTVPSAL
nr:E3 ubiquitin-protein ligase RNF103 isoform X3 [Kogia breviceps]